MMQPVSRTSRADIYAIFGTGPPRPIQHAEITQRNGDAGLERTGLAAESGLSWPFIGYI